MTPPIIWWGAHRLRRGKERATVAHFYWNVSVALPMSWLHDELFSSLNERFARVNRAIDGDTDVARMCTYFVAHFAQVAL